MAIRTNGVYFDSLTTVERDALVLPPNGLCVYNTTVVLLQLNIGTTVSPVWLDIPFKGGGIFIGGYNATTDIPNLTSPPAIPAVGSVAQGYMYKVTVAGTAFFGEILEPGDTLFANVDNPSSLADWTVVQANITIPAYSRMIWLTQNATSSDTNAGDNPNRSVLTLDEAITKAIALTPTENDRVMIYCPDNGIYGSSVATTTLPAGLDIVCPYARYANMTIDTIFEVSSNRFEFSLIFGGIKNVQFKKVGSGDFKLVAPTIFQVDTFITSKVADGADGNIYVDSDAIGGVTDRFVTMDATETYINTKFAQLAADSPTDAILFEVTGGGTVNLHIEAEKIHATNVGLGDAIIVCVLGGGNAFLEGFDIDSLSAPIVASVDGALSTLYMTNYLSVAALTFVETNGGKVYRLSTDEGVYFPQLPATGGLALTDIFKVYKAGIAEQATLTELQTLIGGGGAASELPAVQVLRTTTLNYTLNTFTDVTFNNTDIENDAAVIEHDNVNTDRIDIKETGLYLISYSAHFDAANGAVSADPTLETRVRLNDTSVLNGSLAIKRDHYSGSGALMEEFGNTVAFTAELTAGDFITLQERYLESVSTADNNGVDVRMTVVKLQGATGETGATGAGANIIVQKDDVTVGVVTATLNFEGDGVVSVVDDGGSKSTVTIGGGDFLTATVTPPQITANQNDYSPAGLAPKVFLRINSDANRDITGIDSTGFSDRDILTVVNTLATNIKFKNNSGLSLAGNRFLLNADLTIAVNESIIFLYDATSAAWRIIADYI